MEPGYFRSREFWLALGVGVLVLGGATTAATLSDEVFGPFFGGVPCVEDWDLADEAPAEETAPRYVDGWTEKTITYRLEVAPDTLERLSVCTTVGDISVASYNGTVVEVVVRATLRGAEERPVDQYKPEVHRLGSEATELYVHAPHPPRHASLLKDGGGEVHIEVRVPNGLEVGTLLAYGDVGTRVVTGSTVGALDVRVDVGRVHLQDVTVRGGTRVSADVGDVVGRGLALHGRLDVHTDTGDVDLAVQNVSTAHWRVFTDVGDVHLSVPAGDRIGYDLHLDCDVGSAHADIGPSEGLDRRSRGAADHLVVRSAGYAERAVQVEVRVVTDVGSATVVAR